MNTEIHTLTVDGSPWERPTEKASTGTPHLVSCWSLDEPARVGEVAPLGASAVLGRGDAQPGDLAARLVWYRPRPDGTHAQPPLASRRISRSQLFLEPTPDGRVEIRQLGRCPLLVQGKRVERAVIAPGETFSLDGTALFLVVERSLEVPASRTSGTPFAFGHADADGIVGESPSVWALRERIALGGVGPHHVGSLTLAERLSDLPLLIRFLLRRLASPGSAFEPRFVDANGEVRVRPALVERLLSAPQTAHFRQLERLLGVALESSTGSYVELTPEVATLALESPSQDPR